MSITDFLLARIAEDEEVARDVNPGARAEALDAMTSEHYETWRFLLEQTPERVLAECEAKRLIVNDARALPNDVGSYFAVKYLAAVYADHPDFQEEWRA